MSYKIPKVSLTNDVTGVLPIANGGTNLSTYTTGDILYASATNVLSKLPAGSDNQVLTLASGVPSWASGTTYSEGSFTPTIGSNGTQPTISYGVQRGLYSKIGRQVHVEILITFNSYTAGTGTIEIRGLPFTVNSTGTFPAGSAILSNVVFLGYVNCSATISSTILELIQSVSGSGSASLPTTGLSSSSVIIATCNYEATS